MWNSRYGQANNDLMHDLTLMLISEKIRKTKKYPNRKYVITEENIEVIRESIISVFKTAFLGNIIDNDSVIVDDFELKCIANDILYILYTSNNNIYKESFLKSYIYNICNKKVYLDNIVKSILNIGRNVISPMMKDLFDFEDIFIEDILFNRDNRNEITIVAVKFLN